MSADTKGISLEKPYNRAQFPDVELIVKAELHFDDAAQAQVFIRRLMQLILDFNTENPLP